MFCIKHARRQDGFTMVEMLITLIIMGIVTTMVLGIWFALQHSYAFSINSNNSRSIARDSIARMEREIRDAAAQPDTLRPGVDSGYPYVDAAINLAAASQINFTTPFNDPSEVIEDVAYKYVLNSDGKAGTLYRYRATNPTCIDPTTDPTAVRSTLATNVVNYTAGNNIPMFTYTPTPPPAPTRPRTASRAPPTCRTSSPCRSTCSSTPTLGTRPSTWIS